MVDNPYASPQSELATKPTSSAAGGSLATAMTGDYDFAIMEVIKEAWDKVNGVKAAAWGAFLVFFLGSLVIAAVLAFSLEMMGIPEESIIAVLSTQLIIMLLIYPFLAGIMMIGIHRSVNLPVSASMVFGYFDKTLAIFMAMLIMSLLIILGFIVLILPGIYLSIAYILTIPLIVEKNLGFWAALEASRKGMTHHWFKIAAAYLLMLLIYLLSMIPFGLGLIWTIPMAINLNGILYRTIYGVEQAR